jgi:hypothetical protein
MVPSYSERDYQEEKIDSGVSKYTLTVKVYLMENPQTVFSPPRL